MPDLFLSLYVLTLGTECLLSSNCVCLIITMNIPIIVNKNMRTLCICTDVYDIRMFIIMYVTFSEKNKRAGCLSGI